MNAGKVLRHYAIKLLARREYSEYELSRKLINKHSDNQLVTAIIDELQHADLQSDQRFCENYVRYRSQAGIGPRRICQELQQRGLAEGLIRQVVFHSAIDWQSLLMRIWSKKFGMLPNNATEMVKQRRFLLQRGYDPESIHQLLSCTHEPLE